MMSFRACLLALPIALVAASCGGSSSDVGPTEDAGSADASNNPDGTAGDAGGLDAGSRSNDGGGDGGMDSANVDANDGAVTLDGNDGGGCPDVFGGYTMLMMTGTGCGDLNVSAKQCIVPASSSNVCSIQFNSEQQFKPFAVNGPRMGVDLMPDGTFSGADLVTGSVNQVGCSGSWDAGSQTMTVLCAPPSAGTSCTVTMVRTRSTC